MSLPRPVQPYHSQSDLICETVPLIQQNLNFYGGKTSSLSTESICAERYTVQDMETNTKRRSPLITLNQGGVTQILSSSFPVSLSFSREAHVWLAQSVQMGRIWNKPRGYPWCRPHEKKKKIGLLGTFYFIDVIERRLLSPYVL